MRPRGAIGIAAGASGLVGAGAIALGLVARMLPWLAG